MEEPDVALKLGGNGHNFLLTGPPGTGKSTLLRRIAHQCRQKGKKVAVTATTGMAVRILREKGMKAQTIHKFSGIVDGRYSMDELTTSITCGEHSSIYKLKNIDCLIIDEISMLSAHLFNQVELVCRTVKGNDNMFGGIQIILCGDFRQLKPVPNNRYGDPGDYVFLSDCFRAITHHVTLTKVHRQDQIDLIEAIQELAMYVQILLGLDNRLKLLVAQRAIFRHLWPETIIILLIYPPSICHRDTVYFYLCESIQLHLHSINKQSQILFSVIHCRDDNHIRDYWL